MPILRSNSLLKSGELTLEPVSGCNGPVLSSVPLGGSEPFGRVGGALRLLLDLVISYLSGSGGALLAAFCRSVMARLEG